MVDAGLIVVAAFISPYEEDRDTIRKKLGKNRFVEIFVDCPIEICEQRDVKGLYKRARNSEIKDFTGIDSRYEVPKNPDLVLKTGKEEISVSLNKIADYLKKNFGLQEH
jgi:adenylylsulfate kinase